MSCRLFMRFIVNAHIFRSAIYLLWSTGIKHLERKKQVQYSFKWSVWTDSYLIMPFKSNIHLFIHSPLTNYPNTCFQTEGGKLYHLLKPMQAQRPCKLHTKRPQLGFEMETFHEVTVLTATLLCCPKPERETVCTYKISSYDPICCSLVKWSHVNTGNFLGTLYNTFSISNLRTNEHSAGNDCWPWNHCFWLLRI